MMLLVRVLCTLAAATMGATALAQPPIRTQRTFLECVVDAEPYLAMDWKNFDQGVSPDGKVWGWREIADTPGCETAAADLVAMWMMQNGADLPPDTRLFMTFHEGQLRAMGGDFQRGAELIAAGQGAWSTPEGVAYVHAILAFLSDDKPVFLAARERLLVVPEPPDFARTQRLYREQVGWEPRWPMNIEAVDKMMACWGKGYTGGSQGDCEWLPHTLKD